MILKHGISWKLFTDHHHLNFFPVDFCLRRNDRVIAHCNKREEHRGGTAAGVPSPGRYISEKPGQVRIRTGHVTDVPPCNHNCIAVG